MMLGVLVMVAQWPSATAADDATINWEDICSAGSMSTQSRRDTIVKSTTFRLWGHTVPLPLWALLGSRSRLPHQCVSAWLLLCRSDSGAWFVYGSWLGVDHMLYGGFSSVELFFHPVLD
ncbi:unnamed protein product [Urochloa humidicola]